MPRSLACLILLLSAAATGQPTGNREFRGVWIATVANIDYPSQRGLTSRQQRREFKTLLDAHQRLGLNAVVVQVRPAADAFYARSREPWSYWLTGRQGAAPRPFYDPLAFMVRQCRKRNLDFHAWFNPYRGVFDTAQALADQHPARTHPDWFLTYGKQRLFDPGQPAVRDYLIQVVLDVVRNYDIDAVHFDDYFYPYTLAGDTLRDAGTFARHANGFTNLHDWRRDNVSRLVQALHDSIRAAKPWVSLGVSPFGVWRNRTADPAGSDTQAGQTTYDNLYADVRRWLREGWIDYVAPQIYFSTRHPKVPYGPLLDWWGRNSYGKHVYVGQGTYKIGSNTDSTWLDPGQQGEQLRLNRANPAVHGSLFFSSRSLLKNTLGTTDSLRNQYYRHPALIPPTAGTFAPPPPPASLRVRQRGRHTRLRWQSGGGNTRYFAVYRAGSPRLLATVPATRNGRRPRRKATYRDTSPDRGHGYSVAAVSRTHHLSPSVPAQSRRSR